MMTKGEHMYIRVCTGQTQYPLHNFVVRGDNEITNSVSMDFPLNTEIWMESSRDGFNVQII